MSTMRQEARKLIEAKLAEGPATSNKSFMASIDVFINNIVQDIANSGPSRIALDWWPLRMIIVEL